MRGQIIKDCSAWLAEVDRSIPSVVLSAKTPAGVVRTDVTVSIDQKVIATQLDGRAIDVDPGSHVFQFAAPNSVPATLTVLVLEGTKNQRVEATLAEPILETIHAPVPAVVSPGPRLSGAVAVPPASGSKGAPVWTYAAFGVGAAGLVVGSVFGVLALSTKSNLDSACTVTSSGHACSNPASGSDIDAMHMNSWVANIGFGVGAAGVLGGLALVWFGHPRPAPSSTGLAVQPWAQPGAIGVGGRF
jgi:hypothetical protein